MIESLLGKASQEDEVRVKIDPENLINKVAKYYSLGKRQLLGDSRQLPIVRPRQIVMYLLRVYLKLSLQETGRIIGRDHSTVMSAVGKITNLLSTDVDIQADIMGIKNLFEYKLLYFPTYPQLVHSYPHIYPLFIPCLTYTSFPLIHRHYY